jgi:hypothetical protein
MGEPGCRYGDLEEGILAGTEIVFLIHFTSCSKTLPATCLGLAQKMVFASCKLWIQFKDIEGEAIKSRWSSIVLRVALLELKCF